MDTEGETEGEIDGYRRRARGIDRYRGRDGEIDRYIDTETLSDAIRYITLFINPPVTSHNI